MENKQALKTLMMRFRVIKDPRMTIPEKQDDCLVYTVAEVGVLLGLTKNLAYQAAKRGDFPTIRIGKLIKIPKAALHAMIDGAGAK
jgi:excisionase family DNA binding protein